MTKPPTGWKLLKRGTVLLKSDHVLFRDGTHDKTDFAGYEVKEHPFTNCNYIRRIAKQRRRK